MAQGLEAGGVGGEGGDEDAAIGVLDHLVEPHANAELGARGFLVEHVGRIADQSEHAGIADRAKLRLGARVAKLGIVVQLPVAGVEDAAKRRIDEQRIALGNRMGERNVPEAERAEPEVASEVYGVKLDPIEKPLLLELAGDQAGSERGGVERHAEIVGKIGNGADMILMAVGEDDAEQIRAMLL